MAQAKIAVISGGGPVGALAAVALASQGWIVEVFEKYDLPTSRPPAKDTRAYLLNLTSRALRGFEHFGISIAPLVAPHNGTLAQTFYGLKGEVLRSFSMPVTDPPTNLRVFRDEIGRQLIDEAKRLYPDAIKFHFSCSIKSIDLDNQAVTTSQSNSHDQQVQYDLLVAADGAGSVVRAQLAKSMPEGFVRRIRHKVVYSTVGLSPPADQVPGHAFFQVHQFEAGAVFWNGRGDGDVRIGLFIEQHLAEDIRAGKTKWLHDYLAISLPALPQCGKEAVARLIESKPDFFPLSGWTHVSQLHGHKVVLLGDAAHTMSPILGQGLNCGLEDITVFANVLEQHHGNIDLALPAYSKARWPDVEAMVNINEIVARRDYILETKETLAHKLWLLSHGLLLKMHVLIHTVLNTALPSLFAEPSMMQMLKGQVPYRSVIHSMYRDGLILAGVCTVAVAGLAKFVMTPNLGQPSVAT